MKPFLALLGVAALTTAVQGALAEGENLLINGGFDAEQQEFPEFWSPSPAKNVIYNPLGGPEGAKPSVLLKGDGAASGTVSLRQQGMTLVAGETYKLSAYIKTKGFQSGYCGLVIHNSGWTSAVGITGLPADSDWTFHEKTFTLIPSKNKEYGLAMLRSGRPARYTCRRAVGGGQRSRPPGLHVAMSLVAAPRLVPLEPLLNKFQQQTGVDSAAVGLLPACSAWSALSLLTATAGQQRIRVGDDGGILVDLAGLPCGDHARRPLSGTAAAATISEAAYPITIIDAGPRPRQGRQLNNLVARLLDESIAGSGRTIVPLCQPARQVGLRITGDARFVAVTIDKATR